MNELTQLFCDLSKMPANVSSYQAHILEKYVILIYYGKYLKRIHTRFLDNNR